VKSKLWKVTAYEYRRIVLTKGFVAILLSLPAITILTIVIVALIGGGGQDDAPVGYVDHAGLLADPLPAPLPEGSPRNPAPSEQVAIVAFGSEAEARQALESGEIQAYYTIAADYYQSNRVELVYVEPPDGDTTRQFWDFMQINRIEATTDLPPEIARRATAGSNLIARWSDDGREFSGETIVNNFVPFVAGLLFILLLFMNSGQLIGIVAEEKENRTAELLATTLAPGQFIGGKVAGVLAAILTQVAVWTGLIVLGFWVGRQWLEITLLQNMSLDMEIVLALSAVGLPAFVFISALMAALGAAVGDAQEAQQMAGIFAIPSMLPFYLAQPVMEHPDSFAAIFLSLLPFTSLPTLSMRLAFSRVPAWQFWLAVGLTTAAALGAVWLAGRAFRLGLLRYGQRVRLAELFGRREGSQQ
jgi:ABC-2 type transport system permease protein